MFAVESVSLKTERDRHSEDGFNSIGPSSSMHNESSDIFGAFLNEFTGDTWYLQDTDELSSMSTFTNGDDLCDKSELKLYAAEAPGAMLRAASIKGHKAVADEALQCCEQVDGLEESSGEGDDEEGERGELFMGTRRDLDPLRTVRMRVPGLVAVDDGRALSVVPIVTDSDVPCTQQQRHLEDSEKKAPKASPPLKAPPIAASARRHRAAAPGAFLIKATVSYSAVRAITNTTYLRRMHLSREDAIGLFPEVHRSLQCVFSKRTKRRVSTRLFKIGIAACIQDAAGRRWPVKIECLRTAGQRHVRFNSGWAEMCTANGLAVGKCIRLDRWQEEAFSSSSSSPSSSSSSVSLSSSSSEEAPVIVTISLV